MLAREGVWLSGVVAFEEVSEGLARIGGYRVPPTTVWDHVQRHGERVKAYQNHPQQQVSLDRTQGDSQRYDRQLRKGVSRDGGLVNVRDEGWKAFKAGVVSRLLPPQDQADAVCQETRYTAVLGAVEQWAPALWALAFREHVPYAGHGAVTADGAGWIWTLTADLFPCAMQIVDWYHATEPLAAAAKARYPTDSDAAQRFTAELKDYLIKDEVWRIIALLHQSGLDAHTPYFETHQHRMLYTLARAAGYPIGSGVMESAVKRYKQRLAGPGMRWSRPRAQRMLAIRSAVLNHDFDQLWLAAYPLPPFPNAPPACIVQREAAICA